MQSEVRSRARAIAATPARRSTARARVRRARSLTRRWALQSGTSHFLGQNFARAFDVYFQAADGATLDARAFARSRGDSERISPPLPARRQDARARVGDELGRLDAASRRARDDARRRRGLVLPPAGGHRAGQVVDRGRSPRATATTRPRARVLRARGPDLAAAGVRARVDDRDKMRPGAKYFEWERKGVPLRIEIGPRDLAAGAAVAKRRAGAGAGERCRCARGRRRRRRARGSTSRRSSDARRAAGAAARDRARAARAQGGARRRVRRHGRRARGRTRSAARRAPAARPTTPTTSTASATRTRALLPRAVEGASAAPRAARAARARAPRAREGDA